MGREGRDLLEVKFLADRMLGPLSRYLRMMGYDTVSAQAIGENGPREDTLLLRLAESEGRFLLTRDRELARRAGKTGLFIGSTDVLEQVALLVEQGYIMPVLKMDRCPLCNTPLREATPEEVAGTPYAPGHPPRGGYYWCHPCSRLFWMGSHGRNLRKRIEGRGLSATVRRHD